MNTLTVLHWIAIIASAAAGGLAFMNSLRAAAWLAVAAGLLVGVGLVDIGLGELLGGGVDVLRGVAS